MGEPLPSWSAREYARSSGFQTGEGHALVATLAPRPGERALDLGCGDGRLTATLAATGAFVVGIDADQQMVAAASARGLHAVRATAEALPIASGSQDAVFSNAALHWVADHEAVVGEIGRVLRPGGRLAARMGGAGNQWQVTVEATRLLAEPPYAEHRPPGFRPPWNMADPGLWQAALDDAGLAVQQLELQHSPVGWACEEDMVDWFQPVAHAFTRHLPAALRPQFVRSVVARVWPAVDPQAVFVRLVVMAYKR